MKSACSKLYEFEDKLKLYENRCKLEKLIDKLDDEVLKEKIKELL